MNFEYAVGKRRHELLNLVFLCDTEDVGIDLDVAREHIRIFFRVRFYARNFRRQVNHALGLVLVKNFANLAEISQVSILALEVNGLKADFLKPRPNETGTAGHKNIGTH